LGVGSTAYSVPYDKLKKAALQLSLYAYALRPRVIEKAYVIELTGDGKYVKHELELWDDVALEALIKRYHQWLKR
jgi:hypothetical protein